jgi:hypothetical protein
MDLHTHMMEIAERDNLPADHPIRITAITLHKIFSQKGEKGFADALMDAEAEALAAYATYTGKAFVNTED